MKVIINDYAGHPFQVELSRALARNGFKILHIYCDSVQGAKGNLTKEANDPKDFNVVGIDIGHPVRKYSFLGRRKDEQAYGRMVRDLIRSFEPAVVISANTPLEAHRIVQKECIISGIHQVYWLQDMLGIATQKLLHDRIPVIGDLIGKYYVGLECRLLRAADHVMSISEDFTAQLHKYRVPVDKISIQRNWAPLDEVNPRPKTNEFSEKYELDQKFVYLYSGTLGLKHNPELLLELATQLDPNESVVVIVSEGLGAEWLKKKKEEQDVKSLLILPFQPYEILSDVLSTGDVLLTILEESAGIFSVPSKVLTYMCAGRAQLCAMPRSNLGARVIEQAECGVIVSTREAKEFIRGAIALRINTKLRTEMGRKARDYAEQMFCIGNIAADFSSMLKDLENKQRRNLPSQLL